MKITHYLVILLFVMSCLLTACGQKGPLYMSDQAAQQEQAEEKK